MAIVILVMTPPGDAAAGWVSRLPRGVGVAIAIVPHWDRSLLSSGAYKYAPAMRGPSLETSLTAGELLSYREGSTGTVAVRRLTGHHFAGDRRQGRCVERRRHADAADAGARAAAAPPESGARRDARAWQRRHAWLRAHAIRSPRRRSSKFRRRSSRRRAFSKPRTIARSATRAPRLIVGDGRTHLMLGTTVLRRDRLGAVESVDGGHCVALHARVLRGRAAPGSRRAACCASGRTPTTSATPTCARSSPRSCRSSRMARSGWSATPTCCWSVRPSRSTRASPESRAAMQRPGVAGDLASVGVEGPVLHHVAVRGRGRGAQSVGERCPAADRRSVRARVLRTAQHFRNAARRQRGGAA